MRRLTFKIIREIPVENVFARYASVGDHLVSSPSDGGRIKAVREYSVEDVIHPKYRQVRPESNSI